MTHNNIVLTQEQKLIKENEILGKIALEIILKYGEKNYSSEIKTDEQIAELLNREDWKENNGFSVKEDGKIGWKGVHWYATKPQAVVEKLKEEKEMFFKTSVDYLKESEGKKTKIDSLEEELKDKELMIKELEEKLQCAELDAKTHYDFIGALQKLNGKVRDELHEEIENNLELLEETKNDLEEQKTRVKELEREKEADAEALQEVSEQLEEQKKVSKGLQGQIDLDKKPLPKIPSKFKLFKQKSQAKFKQFQHLAKKVKVQTREFIARIEVRSK